MSTTFWIQLLGTIFGVAMLYITFIKFKRKEINKMEWLIWSSGWILIVFLAIIPSILDPIIRPLNFHRKLDFFVVIGFFVLLALGFYNYSNTKKTQRRMEILVRKIALSQGDENNEKNDKDSNQDDSKNSKDDNNNNN
tara:strand:- start:59 stop:472 length:414 start_codon:yes stop_codon:yes gene_type:complete